MKANRKNKKVSVLDNNEQTHPSCSTVCICLFLLFYCAAATLAVPGAAGKDRRYSVSVRAKNNSITNTKIPTNDIDVVVLWLVRLVRKRM